MVTPRSLLATILPGPMVKSVEPPKLVTPRIAIPSPAFGISIVPDTPTSLFSIVPPTQPDKAIPFPLFPQTILFASVLLVAPVKEIPEELGIANCPLISVPTLLFVIVMLSY